MTSSAKQNCKSKFSKSAIKLKPAINKTETILFKQACFIYGHF